MRTIIITVIAIILFGLFTISCSTSIDYSNKVSRPSAFTDDPALTLLEVRQPIKNASVILGNAKLLYIRGLHSQSSTRCKEAEKILERIQQKIFMLSGQQARQYQEYVKNLILESKRCTWEE
jgi:vancomycin permeability regulator SanA